MLPVECDMPAPAGATKPRASIGKAFTTFAHGRDLALAAELHRTRAVLLLRADAGERSAAEADMRSALEIGQQQELCRFSSAPRAILRGYWPSGVRDSRPRISSQAPIANSRRVSIRQTLPRKRLDELHA